jgi:hypothetical protein
VPARNGCFPGIKTAIIPRIAANNSVAMQKISAGNERGRGLFKSVINANPTSTVSPASKYHRGMPGEARADAGACFCTSDRTPAPIGAGFGGAGETVPLSLGLRPINVPKSRPSACFAMP